MRPVLLIGLFFVPACHDREQPPAPTAQESDQLNETENMLNDMAQNEEGPEANASSPSNSSD